MDEDALVILLRRGLSLEQIAERFGKSASAVEDLMQQYGLEPVTCDERTANGGLARERLEALVRDGMSTREIATELGRSQTNVCECLRRYGLRTRATRRASQVRQAREAGRISVLRICDHHGETEFTIEASGYYRCKRCRMEAVARRRRKVKEILVAEAGGRCCICGYDRYLGALEFHHVDPAQKRLGISRHGVTLAVSALRAEVEKCVLLCSNCHAEVEGGVAGLSTDSRRVSL